jgi:hypothetical protein
MAFGGLSWYRAAAGDDRIRAAAVVAALALAAVHADRFVWALRQAPYLGLLFVAPIATFGFVAVQLALGDNPLAWRVGSAIACLTALAYLLSTTVGLPGLQPQHWAPLGEASLALEALVVASAMAHARRVRER